MTEAIRPEAIRDDSSRPATRREHVPLGILYMLGATVMFAVCSALSKWQVASYSFAEVLVFRSAGSLLTCAALILPQSVLLGMTFDSLICKYFAILTTSRPCIPSHRRRLASR